MRTEVIKADTIDAAVKRILNELGADTRRSSNRENAIYFDGWDSLGASAVLQAVAKRIATLNGTSSRPAGLEFERIIHIDCSKWENKRAVQRGIAEQVKLPSRVIDMFDKQDEEDDFNGLDQGSRGEIEQVTGEIYQAVQNQRFLMILHNGSNEEIDIFNFGLSLYGYTNSKMLWTFQGRFRLDPKMIGNVKKGRTTDVLLSASSDGQDPQDLCSYLVSHEAEQVSRNKHGHVIIDPAIAAECVLYILKQSWVGSHIIDYNWAIHSSNYWICNGIIAPTDINQAWQVGNALQHEVLLSFDTDNRPNNDTSRVMNFSSHVASSAGRMPYWISTTTCGFVLSPSGAINENMFQHSHMIGVLKLSRCTFSFSSPPFLCCHRLRFLWLEHCQDLSDHYQTDVEKEAKESWACFQSLWVLDVRYTDCDRILSAWMMDLMAQLRELNVMGAENWDISHLRGWLRNIRKLRVTKSTCRFNNDLFSDMENIELLEFSGNSIRQGMTSLSVPESNSSLKTVIVDGCDGLKMISFRGCKELKNLVLKGSLGSLEELDLSGTKVKTLDLGGVQYTLPKRIILLGCEKLRAILWPKSVEEDIWRGVLRIDTTSTSASTDGGEARRHADRPNVDQSLEQQKGDKFKDGWQISLTTDARLLRSLYPLRGYFLHGYLHIDIYSPAILGGSNVQGTNIDKPVQVQAHTSTIMGSEYRDVVKDGPVQVMMMMWECPEIPITWWRGSGTCIRKVIMHEQANKLLEDAPSANTTRLFPDFICDEATWWRGSENCIIKVIMKEQANKLLEDAPSASLFPDCICDWATSLHVYDDPLITSIPPQGSGWKRLIWCRVERCPRLHTVFTLPQGSHVGSFLWLRTFWASQLLSARYIWDRPYEFFTDLSFLHLDHSPRLVHVLPLSIWKANDALHALETLEIVYCGDLKEVFPLVDPLEDKIIVFRDLKRVHLHELPKLQRICGHRMSAPELETIKIRGCWSLRRLPAVGRNTKPPKVDCEKEWWDSLEWDGLEVYHHPSLYEPSHSLYYKAQLTRVSVLR